MPSALPQELISPIIDASVLFDFLVWRFSEDTQSAIPPSLAELLRPRPLKALRWYLNLSKPIHTSSQVIAEVYWLAKKSKRRLGDPATVDAFWKLARRELQQLELEEHSVTLEEMDFAEFRQYGPADSSLLSLAARRGAALLAHDQPLQTRCAEREILVVDYNKVASLWQQFGA